MEEEAYSRSELLAAGDNLPERGPLCHECGARIPQFAELGELEEAIVLVLEANRELAEELIQGQVM